MAHSSIRVRKQVSVSDALDSSKTKAVYGVNLPHSTEFAAQLLASAQQHACNRIRLSA